MRIAYFDCFAGASGDMILGALLEGGLSLDALAAQLAKLPLSGYEISAEKAQRGALTGTQVRVILDKASQQPEHRSLSQILALIMKTFL